MKKIALISLVSFVLFGCEEKKVTEEMLLGEWRCSTTEQSAKWNNGEFQDYAPPVDHGTSLIKYLKEDDNLFVKLPDSDQKIKQDFKILNESYENSIDDMKTVIDNKLVYISDNEFKLISEYEVTQDKSEDNVKTKVLMRCTRIK